MRLGCIACHWPSVDIAVTQVSWPQAIWAVVAPPLARAVGCAMAGRADVLSRVPDAQHVRLIEDPHRQQWVLVSLLTGEVKHLQPPSPPPWLLDIDSDGDAFIANSEGDDVALASDLLRLAVYEAPSGRHCVMDESSSDRAARYWLDDMHSHFDFGVVSLKAGNLEATVELDVAIFRTARKGHKTYWRLPSVVKAMSVEVAKRGPGAWLCKGWEKWVRALLPQGLQDHLLKAQCYESTKPGAEVDRARKLPWATASSSGLLALLGMWSFSSRQGCGLTRDSDRQAGREMIDCLLRSVRGAAHLELPIFLDAAVRYEFPGMGQGGVPTYLIVNAGRVDLTRLRSDLQKGPDSWQAHFESIFAGTPSCELLDFFEVAFRGDRRPWHSLGFQLAHSVGLLLDEKFAAGFAGPACAPDGANVARTTIDLDNEYRLERDLVRYRQATLSEAGGKNITYLSGSTDKSRVFGLGLANTCFVKPNNRAWWAPPSVAWIGGGALGVGGASFPCAGAAGPTGRVYSKPGTGLL